MYEKFKGQNIFDKINQIIVGIIGILIIISMRRSTLCLVGDSNSSTIFLPH